HPHRRLMGGAFALLSVASIGAGYPIGGASFDLARADAFATFLAIAAAAVAPTNAEKDGGYKRAFATSALLIAAIFAKQTGIFFASWLFLFMIWRHPKTGVLIALMTLGPCAILFAILNINTGGWFATWLFDMRNHAMMYFAWADPLFEFVRHAPFLI